MEKNMQKILTEPFVQSRIRKHLSARGYGKVEDLKNTELHQKGVDIKLKRRKFGRYFLVEVKGDPSEKVKSPEGSRNSIMNSALGQIVTRMHTKRKKGLYKYGYKYGIGFPASFKKRVLSKIPFDICHKLNLYIFLVNHSGVVEEYDHKKLKTIQLSR